MIKSKNLLPYRPGDEGRSWGKKRRRELLYKKLAKYGINNIWRLVLSILVAGTFIFSLSLAFFSIGLPNPVRLSREAGIQSTKILDREGQVLYDIHGEKKRTPISFDEQPEVAKQATIAIEDKNFYHHQGFDISGLVRGIVLKPLSGQRAQGGSTITQQLAKNALLSSSRTIPRKIKEFILALQIEQVYSKDKILELYLNEIPYGRNAYGIESASQTFFAKPAGELTLAEAALLASLPQAPTYYSPDGSHAAELKQRQELVLDMMVRNGFITENQAEAAKGEDVLAEIVPRRDSFRAPHFVFYVREQLAEKYGDSFLEEAGLKITTTLDLDLQTKAEDAIDWRAQINAGNKVGNNGLVAINPKTGEILAMVGSRDYFDVENEGNFNVTTSLQQPGSSFKPFVYAAAFKAGYSPATMLMDTLTDFGDYIPQNYDNEFRGPVSMRYALSNSLNIPAVKTLALVGVHEATALARSLGITTLTNPDRYGLSLVLGGGDVRLLDMVYGYSAFANTGFQAEMNSIIKVEDKNGKVLFERDQPKLKEVLDPQVAYLINDILSDDSARIETFGAGGYLTVPGYEVAAKTGTTQGYRDGWTIGYTPTLAVGVWGGNNDNSEMTAGVGGYTAAAPIWNRFMRQALPEFEKESFKRPRGIQEVEVDALSGKLPTVDTPSTKTEVFVSFALPREKDNVHKKFRVVKFAPQFLAPAGFDENLVEDRAFAELHSVRRNNPKWEQPVLEWATANGYNNFPTQIYTGSASGETNGRYVRNLTPTNGQVFGGSFTVNFDIVDITPKRVELFYDNAKINVFDEGPYNFTINPTTLDGKTHSLLVRVFDENGLVDELGRYVVVGSSGSGNNAVTAIFSGPGTVSVPFNLTVDISLNDSSQSITEVEFIVGGTKIGGQAGHGSGRYEFEVSEIDIGAKQAMAKIILSSGLVINSNVVNFNVQS